MSHISPQIHAINPIIPKCSVCLHETCGWSDKWSQKSPQCVTSSQNHALFVWTSRPRPTLSDASHLKSCLCFCLPLHTACVCVYLCKCKWQKGLNTRASLAKQRHQCLNYWSREWIPSTLYIQRICRWGKCLFKVMSVPLSVCVRVSTCYQL